jgi:hypothetical protein
MIHSSYPNEQLPAGPSTHELNTTPTNELGSVEFSGIASHGFYRGYVRVFGDGEFTQIFSSASPNAHAEWVSQRQHLALQHIATRSLFAEAALREMASTSPSAVTA